jgi:hypothetical protein
VVVSAVVVVLAVIARMSLVPHRVEAQQQKER